MTTIGGVGSLRGGGGLGVLNFHIRYICEYSYLWEREGAGLSAYLHANVAVAQSAKRPLKTVRMTIAQQYK